MTGVAALVLGPESSGTRLTTRVLVEGCDMLGDWTHQQRLDVEVPNAEAGASIAWRRSFPHFREWPSVSDMFSTLVARRYRRVRALVCVRARYAVVASQLSVPHVGDVIEADRNVGDAYIRIFSELDALRIPFLLASYESLVLHTEATQRDIASFVGVELARVVEVYDGNEKWSR